MKWFWITLLIVAITVLSAAFLVWFMSLIATEQSTTIGTTQQKITSDNSATQDTPTLSSSNTEVATTDNSDAHSCDQDYITYCQGTPPGKINLVNCLLNEHYDEISDACRNSLERRQQLNEELVAACTIERAKFCQGVEPKVGSEPMVDCLGQHYAQLSPDCTAAFDAHEAAKLTK